MEGNNPHFTDVNFEIQSGSQQRIVGPGLLTFLLLLDSVSSLLSRSSWLA